MIARIPPGGIPHGPSLDFLQVVVAKIQFFGSGAPAHGRRFVMSGSRSGGAFVSVEKVRTAHVRVQRSFYSEFTAERFVPKRQALPFLPR
ncbi:hypothetical protein [Variovorax sp. Root411]|uniref:hypothetical protein n=1 Tax=Variovorax sp. Root411 TaxID=1736530 RepID=UPI0006F20CAE|nr:hypothetical protein [Variovorax sp. Root411]KQW54564.1 hypothetical protein ASC92_21365 [Variovorax sp. Root411]